MCIIAICEKRKLTDSEFSECWESNRHGFGYAYWTGDHVVMAKGFMDKHEAHAAYDKIPLPHVAHFRIASAGEVCPELTHPFICSPKSGLLLENEGVTPVLFHNGTVTDWRSLLLNTIFQTKAIPKGPMSDSRAMAMAISVVGPEILTMYATHKWVMVAKDGFVKVGDWIEAEGGVLFSNGGFRRYVPAAYTSPKDNGFGMEDLFEETGTEVEEEEWKERPRAAQIRGAAECPTCQFFRPSNKCTKRGELRDLYPCKEYRPGGSLNKNKDKDRDVCGARAVIKNGKLEAVEENYLDRLARKYSGSQGKASHVRTYR